MQKFTALRTPEHKPLMSAFSLFALVGILCLLYAGGFTTSIKAGMAFTSWPLSNGSLNPEGWMDHPDQLAEHSHRLLGMLVGLLSLILFVWTWLREERAWMRWAAGALLGFIILQGLLGGARVRFDQLVTQAEHNRVAQTFAIIHACGAQLILCLLVALATAGSRSWIKHDAGLSEPAPLTIRRWGLITFGLIFLQLIAGALMRHNDAGLAIPTFPLTPEGGLLPRVWSLPVALHFSHRIGALLVTVALVIFVIKIARHPSTRRALGWDALGLVALLSFQILLGASVIWTTKHTHTTTLHVLVGALLLTAVWRASFITFRLPLEKPSACPQTS